MDPSHRKQAFPEVWGGIECTVNRVGDTYFEQLFRTGHVDRPDDLDLFAELGIKAIRYPVLWEQIAPDGLESADWTWPDRQLRRLRELGIRPIVGLVHHGSGPRDTSLTDPAFPERLAAFAGAVARRYPWIEDYTPVNEPLTTARFSALYGHWYPHLRDSFTFAQAILGQTRAVVLAMQAIRDVTPTARLIQTDDLGRTYSSPTMAYQAEFENERRWLTFDLLTGRLTPDRPLWGWLRWIGVQESSLEWFLDHRCPPDILGFNTYLSSERYLDDRIDRYPGEPTGTNGRHTYVDVLAARVLPEGLTGTDGLLGEAWDRYRLPLAITEVHNGGDREEQLRWLDEVWRGAVNARQAGADVQAVTVWALLGLFDWPDLVTRQDNVYEPGVFDIRGLVPRPTAIARMVSDLAEVGQHNHPVLAIPGWWRRSDRFWYQTDALEGHPGPEAITAAVASPDAQPVLIVGERNRLRSALEGALASRVIPHHILDLDGELPGDIERIGNVIDGVRAWAVIDTGSERWCEGGDGATLRCSCVIPGSLATMATACADREIPLLSFSSDVVFDDPRPTASTQGSAGPRDAYQWRRQLDVEEQAIGIHPQTLIVRTGPLFDMAETGNVAARSVEDRASDSLRVPRLDELVAPTYVPGLAHAAIDLLLDGAEGIWHFASQTAVSWTDFERWVSANGPEPIVILTKEPPSRAA